MNTYILLLRGINVGGNNIIKMADLKTCLEEAGFQQVKTYIQSGNVIFKSKEIDLQTLTNQIELLLSVEFNYNSKVVLIAQDHYQRIISAAPDWWGKGNEYKHNLLFIKPPLTSSEALLKCGKSKPEIELTYAGEGVIYLSASNEHILKTNFVKLPSNPIYKQMTVRNFNTSMRLLALMSE